MTIPVCFCFCWAGFVFDKRPRLARCFALSTSRGDCGGRCDLWDSLGGERGGETLAVSAAVGGEEPEETNHSNASFSGASSLLVLVRALVLVGCGEFSLSVDNSNDTSAVSTNKDFLAFGSVFVSLSDMVDSALSVASSAVGGGGA